MGGALLGRRMIGSVSSSEQKKPKPEKKEKRDPGVITYDLPTPPGEKKGTGWGRAQLRPLLSRFLCAVCVLASTLLSEGWLASGWPVGRMANGLLLLA